ncbi:hypothetical protein [Apibacter sp. wkB309]|uniref:hypothetical protein n=1 Tax=Apibacter sp. wkB309 TaxID=1679467 RepID=UPI000CF96592|nr:hypothetical protein [Apibacter sp. wkB309]PQL90936.1 hypothetical protein C4S75_05565 [Apibacter sp. wkB309]
MNNTENTNKNDEKKNKNSVNLNESYIKKISLNLYNFSEKLNDILTNFNDNSSKIKLEELKKDIDIFDKKMLKDTNIKFTKKDKDSALELLKIMM